MRQKVPLPRKITSSILSIVLVVGLMPTPAIAEGGGSAGSDVSQASTEPEIEQKSAPVEGAEGTENASGAETPSSVEQGGEGAAQQNDADVQDSEASTLSEENALSVNSLESNEESLSALEGEDAGNEVTPTEGWTASDTCEWKFDASTGTLTIQPIGGGTSGELASWTSDSSVPWYANRANITSVVVKEGVSAKTCRYMFYNCSKLTSVDLSGLDTSNVTDMFAMFGGCSSLTSVDVSGLDASKVTNMTKMFLSCTNLKTVNLSGLKTSTVTSMDYMFNGCANLKRIYASKDFSTAAVSSSVGMFLNCKAIVGENGTTYNADKTTASMAKVDTAEAEGYFSLVWNESGTCEWYIDESGVLTIRPADDAETGKLDAFLTESAVPWNSARESIKSVVIQEGVIAPTCDYMFKGCTNLKSVDLSGLTIENGAYLTSMFQGCTSLESVDLTGLDTSGVVRMNSMFKGCTSLTSVKLAGINTSKVTSMANMFYKCTSLTSIDLTGLNTSAVTNMSSLFDGCTGLVSVNISGIDTSAVTNMNGMFADCTSLTTIYASSDFDTSKVTDGAYMFYNCTVLVGGSGSKVDSENANVDKTYAKVDGGTDAPGYFTNGWKTSGGCEWMIDANGKLTVRVANGKAEGQLDWWNSYKEVPWYADRESITSAVFEEGVKTQTCASMFNGCKNLVSVDLSGLTINDKADSSMSNMFKNCSSLKSVDIAGLNTSRVTSMSYMFRDCTSLTSINLAGLDTSAVTSMSNMFRDCTSLVTANISDIDTSAVKSIDSMFDTCTSLTTIYASSDFNTSAVTDSGYMFYDCKSLVGGSGSKVDSDNENVNATYAKIDGGTENPGYFTNGWNVSGSCEWLIDGNGKLTVRPANGAEKGTLGLWTGDETAPWSDQAESIKSVVFESGVSALTCRDMFKGCTNLTSVDLVGLNTSAVENMSSMFNGCSSLTAISLAGFDTSNVKNMSSMFAGCSGLTSIDLTGIDTTKVTAMASMFNGCSSLTTVYVSSEFNTDAVTSSAYMFYGCNNLIGGNGTAFDAEAAIDKTYAKVDGGTETPGYFTSGWNVSGECEWFVDGYGKLTIRPVNGTEGKLGTWSINETAPWCDKAESIKSVVIEEGVVAQTCAGMFKGCTNLTSIDLSGLDTSSATIMNSMFSGCSSLKTVDLAGFDTSKVTNMSSMFAGCSSLESIDLTGIDTTKVTAMVSMFNGCSSLATIYVSSDFSTAAVTSSAYMFAGCTKLVGGNGTEFDSTVVDKTYAKVDGGADNKGYFTSGWNVSGDCEWLIDGYGKLTIRPANGAEKGTLGLWTGDETAPWYDQAASIKSVVIKEGVSALTCRDMFKGCINLTSIDLAGLDTSAVTSMYAMFEGCSSLKTIDVTGFNTSKVTNMGNMFCGCSGLSVIDITGFNTANVTNMSSMFNGCSGLNSINLAGFDTANVTNMSSMFSGCSGLFTIDLTDIDTSKVQYMTSMFSGCTNLVTIYASSSFNTDAVTTSPYMFANCNSLVGGNGTAFDSTKVDKTYAKVDGGADNKGYFTSGWIACGECEWLVDGYGKLTIRPANDAETGKLDTWSVNDAAPWCAKAASIKSVVIEEGVVAQTCASMFKGCANLTSIDLEGLDTSNATTMSSMFNGCSSLKAISLAGFNTSKVTNMSSMFAGCSSLEKVDITSIDTAKVQYMSSMFSGCTNLVTIYASSDFNTEKVTASPYMFANCNSLVGGNGTAFDANAAIDKTYAKVDGGTETPGYFTNGWNISGSCEWLVDGYGKLTVRPANGADEGTLAIWLGDETAPWYDQAESIKSVVIEEGVSAQTCRDMFKGCTNLTSIDLSGLDTSAVENMNSMFNGCSSLKAIDITGLNTSDVTNMSSMFTGCSSLEKVDITGIDTTKVTAMVSMFNGCANLTTIYASPDFNTDKVTSSAYMFFGCNNLAGGNGTAFDSAKVDKTYAKVDGGTDVPGYFTSEWVASNECEWMIDGDGRLIIRPANEAATGKLADWSADGKAPWVSSAKYVKSVVIEEGVVAQTCVGMFEGYNVESINLTNLDTSSVTSMANMFKDCTKLESVEFASIDTSKVTNMSGMFSGCTGIAEIDLAKFDTSAVTDMSSMFSGCSDLATIYVSAFNVEAVTASDNMFAGCAALVGGNGTAFDAEAAVDVTRAIIDCDETAGYFTGVWYECGTCEWQIDGNGKLTIRPADGADAGELDAWNADSDVPWAKYLTSIKSVVVKPGVSAKTCRYMFYNCKNLTSVDVSGLDTSKVTNMYAMFGGCSKLTTVDVYDLDTSEVTNMGSMFLSCEKLETIDLTGIDTSKVIDMSGMFNACINLETVYASLDFDIEKVKDSTYMFRNCSKLVGGNGTSFDASLTGAEMASVDGYDGEGYFTLKEGLSEGWKLAGSCEWQIADGILDVRPLGNGESGTLPKWDNASEVPWYNNRADFQYALLREGVKAQTCESMFEGCTNLYTVLFEEDEFYNCDLNTTGVTSMANMFKDCTSLRYTEGLSSLDTSKVTDMSGMFSGCSAITVVYLNNMDISSVTNTSNMFNGCSKLGRIYSGVNFNTDKVASSTNMFLGCTNLVGADGDGAAYSADSAVDKTRAIVGSTTNKGLFSAVWTPCGNAEWSIDGDGKLTVRNYYQYDGKLDAWDNVTTFSPWKGNTSITSVVFEGVKAQTCAGMFEGCTNITSVDLSGLDTSAATDMSNMFSGCTNITEIDLTGLNTSKVENMSGMLKNTGIKTLDLNGVETSEVTNMSEMLSGCTKLTTVYAPLDFDTEKVTSSTDMFKGCTALVGGNGTEFSANAVDVAMASVDGYTGASYFTLKEGLTEGWKLCGSCQWYVDENGKLTISPLNGATAGTLANWASKDGAPWLSKSADITSVDIKTGVKAQTCASMFKGCSKLTTVDLTNLDVTDVTDISSMFSGCSGITNVPTGLTIPTGENAKTDDAFYLDSEKKVITYYDGTDEAVKSYDWASDNRILHAGHTWVDVEITKEPTCTTPGEKTVKCSICEEVKTGVEVDALGHDWNCVILFTEDGTEATAIWTCKRDASHLVVASCNVTKQITTAASCTEDEITTYTATAVKEGMPTSTATAKRTTGEALGHSFTTYTYNKDAKCEVNGTETATCDRDGCEVTDTRTKENSALGHSFTNYVYQNDAKCEVDGTEKATCDREGCEVTDTRTKEGSALGHDWGEAEVVPAEDMSSATATWVCTRGNTHKRVVLCPVTKTVSTKATCFKPGEWTYTAKAMVDNEVLLEKVIKTEVIPATGHNFKNGVCTECGTKLGDVNGNGVVNSTDAQIVYDIVMKDYYKDLDSYAAFCSAADVTGPNGIPDGEVDAQDAYRILYISVFGWTE